MPSRNPTSSASPPGPPPSGCRSWCWALALARFPSAGAFAGAFAAFAFVALLTNGARGGNERTILAGVAASQLFNAITAYTISTSASAQQARDVMFWLLGSFSGVRWPEFQLVIVVVLAGLAVCLWYARALDAFTFGDDAAASLGIAVPRVRLILFTTAALITATIVSMAYQSALLAWWCPT